MNNFTRIILKKLKGQENDWRLKLSKMAELTKEAEYATVKKKIRKADLLVAVNPDIIDSLIQRVNKDGLVFTFLGKIKKSNDYTATVKQYEPGKPFAWQAVITRNRKDANLFKKFFVKRDKEGIGHMLGYPDCCIKYFERVFPIDHDPIWVDTKKEIVKGYPECNQLLHYFGPRIVPHITCSPTCEASRKIGRVWFKVMEEIDKDLADEMYDLLASPMTWSSYHGIIQVDTPYFIALTNSEIIYLRKPRIIRWQAIKSIRHKKKVVETEKVVDMKKAEERKRKLLSKRGETRKRKSRSKKGKKNKRS